MDLTRSIGFAEQQSGVVVNSVWLFGAGAEAQVPVAQPVLKLPVKVSPVEYTPFYWAEQAARLPEKDDGNLIGLDVRQAPQRQRMLTLTGIILLIFLVLALAGVVAIEVVRQVELKSIKEIDRLIVKLQDQRNEWQKKYGEAARKKEIVRIVSDERFPPIPAFFLGYLGDAVPDNIMLSDLRVTRTNDFWAIRLAGAAQSFTNQTGVVDPEQSFNTLSNSLVTGPFRFDLTSWSFGPQPANARTGPPGIGRLGALASASVPPSGPTNRFAIEGVIR